MLRRILILGTLAALLAIATPLVITLPASTSTAASVGPSGQFNGTTAVSGCSGTLASYRCTSVSGSSTLCTEYAVLGSVLGSPCNVTWNGSVSGSGTTANGRTTCTATGGLIARVTSPSFPGGQDIPGTLVIKDGAATFHGVDQDAIYPDGSTATLAFTAGCNQTVASGLTTGEYQVLSLV
jgi:hypothetical protein